MALDHRALLRETFSLARRGEGLVSPNPMVGCVIAAGRRVVARGYHRAFGLPHAEAEALAAAGARARNARLYVNLEPCCHHGKTPPCTDAIIRAGIKEVFCCMEDPNPLVAGKGFARLEAAGIAVRKGWLQDEAEHLNRSYIVSVTCRRPYVTLKWAQSIDGRIAPAGNGDSRWITGEQARRFSRQKRFAFDAILVGVETVLRDDPSLDWEASGFTARKTLLQRKRYRKVILDARLRTPATGRLWENPQAEVIIAASRRADPETVRRFAARRCEVLLLPEKDGMLDLRELLGNLHERGVGSLLVEGGSRTLTSFWKARLADTVMVFIGGMFLGGEGLPPLAIRIESLCEAARLSRVHLSRLGDDLLIEGDPCFPAS